MLAGRRGEPFGIRFDTPARLSRLGPEFAWERILEHRSFKSARILLPWGDEVSSEMAAVLPAGVAAVPLPVPIETDDLRREGGAVAVTYAGNPWKKGLDLIVRAWSIVRPETELVIAGISRENGLAYLRRCNLAEPTGVTWAGITSHEEFARSPAVRRYTWLPPGMRTTGSPRLEALADGALLVTVPSDGPYAALRLARRLAPRLAPQEISAEALAEAMRAALEMTDAERGAYREAAARELAPHSFEELVRRIRDKVLPTLLAEADGRGKRHCAVRGGHMHCAGPPIRLALTLVKMRSGTLKSISGIRPPGTHGAAARSGRGCRGSRHRRERDDRHMEAQQPQPSEEHPVVVRLARETSLSRGAARGSVWLTLGTGAQQAFQFGISIVMARLLTPGEFGQAAVVFSVAAFARFHRPGIDRISRADEPSDRGGAG